MPLPFKIYRSSAGSGKTYTLAREYLKLALRSPSYFQHILAVTFTNKATQEMKDRIIQYLNDFSNGSPHEMANELMRYFNLDNEAFQKRCRVTLAVILHQYSNFSVTTIDAFFQKVIRAFSKEAGLHGGFTLELDQNNVLEEVVDHLMEEVGDNKILTEWLLEFSKEKVDEGKSWDVRGDIKSLGQQIFKEEFKLIEVDLLKIINDPHLLKNQVKELQSMMAVFKNTLKSYGEEGLKLIANYQLNPYDLAQGSRGIGRYFENLVGDKFAEEPNSYVRKALEDDEQWYSKSSKLKDEISQLRDNGLRNCLEKAINFWKENCQNYFSSSTVLKNLYTYGIFSDLTRKLQEYKKEHDVMLISDAAFFLKSIIGGNDSPFIYEKVGNFFNHFLIDEFQDTSEFQWENFKPLVENSLSEGFSNLIVGDVKQSIYRWRGGDWQLLLNQVQQDIHKEYIDNLVLDANYRSKPSVINFNNKVFAGGAELIKQSLQLKLDELEDGALKLHLMKKGEDLSEAYATVVQNQPAGKKIDKRGYVSIKFKTKDEEKGTTWKEESLLEFPAIVEQLQDQKVRMKEVAVLVRNAREGKMVADFMIEFQQADLAKPGYNYNVISNESLYLNASPCIQLILNLLRVLINPKDQVAMASVVYEYQCYVIENHELPAADLLKNADIETLHLFMPNGFLEQRYILSKLPLFELVERLIQLFTLDKVEGALGYLQSFQDQVLKYSGDAKGDLGSFLEWWEENGEKLSVQVPDEIDAVQILTIHKSKGLQFKVVIIPFLSWSLDAKGINNNIIWARSQNAPFNKLGYFPLSYNSSLSKTVFKQDYFEEMIKFHLDNLNLLYVAFTRAEDGLIAFGEAPNFKKIKTDNTSNLVYQLLEDKQLFDADYWVDENHFQIGDYHEISATSSATSNSEPVELDGYRSNIWRDKLRVKQRSELLAPQAMKEVLSRINYGLVLHELMARLNHKDQLAEALQELLDEGLVNKEEANELSDKMKELLKEPLINEWFSCDWQVKTEVPILPESGEMKRLDRVMLKDDRAIIVDFKTGEKKNSDFRQVKNYSQLLSNMGYNDIKAYLLYVDQPEIIEVN